MNIFIILMYPSLFLVDEFFASWKDIYQVLEIEHHHYMQFQVADAPQQLNHPIQLQHLQSDLYMQNMVRLI